MSARNKVVTVEETATRLDTQEGSAAKADKSFLAYNDGPDEIRVGGPEVTASGSLRGIPVPAGSYLPEADFGRGDGFYAVCASGDTADVLVYETGIG